MLSRISTVMRGAPARKVARWRALVVGIGVFVPLVAVTPPAASQAPSLASWRLDAAAFGVGYRLTYPGDSLNVTNLVMPYAEATSSQSASLGQAALAYPGGTAVTLGTAVPLLADTIPVLGTPVPQEIQDVVKLLTSFVPPFPFFASASGGEASRIDSAPGVGSGLGGGADVSPARVACDPRDGGYICESNAGDLSIGLDTGQLSSALGPLAGVLGAVDAEFGDVTSLISVDSLVTTATATARDQGLAESDVRMAGLSILGGLITLDSLHMNLRATTDGDETVSEAPTLSVGGVSVAGTPVALVDGPADPEAPTDPLTTVAGQLNDLLTDLGIGPPDGPQGGPVGDVLDQVDPVVSDILRQLPLSLGGGLGALHIEFQGPQVRSNDEEKADPGLNGAALKMIITMDVPVLGATTTEVFLGSAAVSAAGIGRASPAGVSTPPSPSGVEVPDSSSVPSFSTGSFEAPDIGGGLPDVGGGLSVRPTPVVAPLDPASASGFLAANPHAYTALVGLFGLWQVFGVSVLTAIARHRHGLVRPGNDTEPLGSPAWNRS